MTFNFPFEPKTGGSLVESANKNIFVYGTLKVGHGNIVLLMDVEKVGTFETAPRYALFGHKWGIPFLWHGSSVVRGEVYRVDPITLRDVDALEGHPDWYHREPIELVGFDEEVEAYFCMTNSDPYEGDIHEY